MFQPWSMAATHWRATPSLHTKRAEECICQQNMERRGEGTISFAYFGILNKLYSISSYYLQVLALLVFQVAKNLCKWITCVFVVILRQQVSHFCITMDLKWKPAVLFCLLLYCIYLLIFRASLDNSSLNATAKERIFVKIWRLLVVFRLCVLLPKGV